MHLLPAYLHEFVDTVRREDTNVLREAGVSQHLRALITDAHACTWHSVQGLEEITMDTVGSKPGDPLGSILFNYLAVSVLGEVAKRSEAAGLLATLPPACGDLSRVQAVNGPLPLSDVTYADDSVFFGAPGTADDVIDRAIALGTIVVSTFQRFCLRLSAKANKTEFMFRITGKGAMNARLRLVFEEDTAIKVEVAHVFRPFFS